jgi:competence protein ComEA
MKLTRNLLIALMACLLPLGALMAQPSTTTSTTGTAATAPASSSTSKVKDSTAIVNINTADAATLETLKGIGPKRAAAIMAYRQQNGSFTSAQDLLKVKDIPKTVLSENTNRIVVQ